jgi:hypothetical protein
VGASKIANKNTTTLYYFQLGVLLIYSSDACLVSCKADQIEKVKMLQRLAKLLSRDP